MINHFFRNILRILFGIYATFISWDNKFQRMKFRKRYAFYYGRNAIGTFPVTDFQGQKERLAQVFEKMHEPKFYAQTSGTTKEPKLVPYDLKRTKFLQKTFMKSMITMTRDIPGDKTFFVFASLHKDSSLTAGMLDEGKAPSYFELLQAPYRYLRTKEGRALIERVGELSARIMVLAITQPRFLYATNPSTLTFFLKELDVRWKEVRVRLKNVPPGLMRLSDSNGERLMMTFLMREKAPRLQELLPDLKAVITWDGGYVRPFLNQLKVALPGIQFLPMYSMSTETIETLPHQIGEKISFLPLSRGMYPEFQDTENDKILSPFDLIPGKTYGLIVSDEWGLRRYDTHDIFLVNRMVQGIPELSFMRRKGLTSSLTGEKLTEDHVLELTQSLQKKFSELAKLPLALFPVAREKEFGYELVVIGRLPTVPKILPFADEELGRINSEYRAKVSSGRLLPLTVSVMSEQELASLMGREKDWESQFKVLPLYEKLIVR